MTNVVKTAIQYTPTKHALDRANLRFGIEPHRVAEWVNDLMRGAKYVASNGKNGLVYENDGVRLVIDGTTRAVITVHHALSTAFLHPVLERELRKIKREYTSKIRLLERSYAEALRELADMAINRAKARNPQTRDLISERMTDKQSEIDRFVRSIERMSDEYKAKQRAIELIAE